LSDSVFTTVRVADFKPVWIEDHLLRLKKSALMLNIPFDEDVWIEEVIKMVEQNKLGSARMRMIIDGCGNPQINFEPFHDSEKKMSIRFKNIEPQGDLKVWPFRKHAERSDEEVILIDRNNGNVLEGSYTNVFVKIGNEFFTPPDDGRILPGICRKHFIRYLKLKGYTIHEKHFGIEKLKNSEIFFTNALRGVIKGGIDV
jgi:para-aminobenzoate synthetase / 4-amino-4-deoxychorismate lyase